MATYTATITQPDYVGNFAYELHCRGPYSATFTGVQGNAADFVLWNAAVDALPGLSNSTITAYTNGGITTLVFTVEWDELDTYYKPVFVLDVGSGNIYTSSFVGESICATCYDIIIDFCDTSATLAIELEPSTDYMIHITDSLNNVYESSATSGAGGDILLILSDFGAGNLFTPFGGIYEIKFHTTISDEFVNFTVGTTTYSCINLTVEDVTTV